MPGRNRAASKTRKRRGSQLIEAVAVGTVLIVIAMALIDLIVMVLANGVNDAASKNAARAAANQNSFPKALTAAKNAVQDNKKSSAGFITSLTLQSIDYDPGKTVSAKTKMEVSLPIPVPGVGSSYTFMAQDTEPIVAH
jgi:Flp pilus assembly protein TadG